MEWFLYSWPTLVLFGLGLRMALRLTYGARGPEPGDPIHVFLNTASWVLIAMGLVPAVVGGTFTFVGGILGLLAITTLVEVLMHRRGTQRRSMSKMLALLVERGQQLDASALFAGQTMRGVVGRAAEKLLAALRRGAPLAEAVTAYPRALPREAIAYVSAGRSMQAEAAALRELAAGDAGELGSVWRACVDRISYLVFVLLIMVVVLTFIMIKVVPEFEQIFWEFDVELPQITLLAISFSDFFTQYLAAPIGLTLAALILGAIVVGICYLSDVPVLRPWGDLLFRSRGTPHVLRILAVATDQRQPLDDVLDRLARVYPSAPLRSQLSRAAIAVREGSDWRDALLGARVVTKAEQGLLKTAERARNLPWALRQIARRREKRTVYRLVIALQVLYPLAILLFGAFVGFYVVSLFVPLVELTRGLA